MQQSPNQTFSRPLWNSASNPQIPTTPRWNLLVGSKFGYRNSTILCEPFELNSILKQLIEKNYFVFQ